MNKDTSILSGPIVRPLMAFALPVLLSNLFQSLYNTIDVMIVGHALGTDALAAMGAASPVFELLVCFGLGMGTGVSIIVGQCIGYGDRDRLKGATACGLVLAVVTGLLLTILGLNVVNPLLVALGTPETVLVMAQEYLHPIVTFVWVMLGYNLLAGMLRAVGDSVMPMVALLLSSLLNVGLDFLFVLGLDMGITGAAWATVLAQGISMVLSLVCLCIRHKEMVPQLQHFRLQKRQFTEMLGLGVSQGLVFSLIQIGTLVLQSGINSLGTAIMASHTASRKIFGFCFMPLTSLAAAVSVFVSQNYGAGNMIRIRKVILATLKIDLVIAIVLTLVMVFFAPQLIYFISGSNDPELIAQSTRYCRFFAPMLVVLGYLLVLRNALSAMGKKGLPIISSITEMGMKLGFTWLLVPIIGYDAIIMCEPFSWALMTIQLHIALHRSEVYRPRKPRPKQEEIVA